MAWYSGLFGSDSGISDPDQQKLANQGLLQAGLGILAMNGRPGTTPFQALAGGLLGGLGGVQQGAADLQNQRYKNAIEQSTLANMQAAQAQTQREQAQKRALHDALAANTDASGNVNIAGAVRTYGKSYPEDAANALTMLHGGKPELKDTPQGALQVYPDGYNAYLQAGGLPQAAQMAAGGMPASIPAPIGAPGGASSYAPPPPLLAAVQQTESGGNPNAVSPKGARGLLQVTDATAANPGYGIAPSNGTMADRYRVGQQYLGTMLSKYGTIGGLAAYNAGPGSWEQHLQAANGDQQAALAAMPAETQAYVPKVLQAAGANGLPHGANPSGLPAGRIQLSKEGATPQKQQEVEYLVNNGVPRDQAIASIFGIAKAGDGQDQDVPSADAIDNMAWDKILNGINPQYSRGKTGDKVRNAVNNRVAQIAKDNNVSPQDLVTVAGRNKAIQGSLNYTVKQQDALERQAETFRANFQNLLDLSDKVSRTGVPAFNKLLLNVKNDYQGDPDTAAFITQRNLAAQEYAKIAMQSTGAGGTTEGAREHALEAINAAQTPEQLRSVFAQLSTDIDNQKAANTSKIVDLQSRKTAFGNQSAIGQAPQNPALNAALFKYLGNK